MSPKNLTCEIDDVKLKTRKSQLEPLRGIHFFLSAVSMYIVFQHNFFKNSNTFEFRLKSNEIRLRMQSINW